MDKASITMTDGDDWLVERITLEGEQRFPGRIRVGGLGDRRSYVPVVRCSECACASDGYDGELWCGSFDCSTDPDGFCAWGERR